MKKNVFTKGVIVALAIILMSPLYVHAQQNDTVEGIQTEITEEEIVQEEKAYIQPEISSISSSVIDQQNGIFQLKLQKIQNSDKIRNIQCAVWSEVNWQDDLVWYDMQPDGTGGYSRNISISDHKYDTGIYQLHVYVTDINGARYFAGSTAQEISIQTGTLSLNSLERESYRIQLTGVQIPGGIKEVQFPVWSDLNGQDDIIWYRAELNQDGSFTKTISLKDHKGLGNYNVHAYAVTNSGDKIFLGSTIFTTEVPATGNVTIDDYNQEKGTFRIVISDIIHEELIDSISVPVWSEVNGQDDVIWYNAVKENGQYVADVDIKDHKYSMGQYDINVYVTDITGTKFCTAATAATVDIQPGSWDISQLDNGKAQYRVKIYGVSVPGSASEIQFPVWSDANWQDDIIWYTATRQLDDTYEAVISIKDYKSLGKFHVHAYAVMPNGEKCFINKSEFETPVPNGGQIIIDSSQKQKGKFQVKITDVQNSEYIEKMEVPVWSDANQNDIIWYTAEKNSNGDYTVNVDIKDHKYNIGEYQVHLYMTDLLGNRSFVNKTVCDMKASYAELSAVNEDHQEKDFSIILKGLQIPGGEKEVLVAVWGETGGQNDLRWYTARKEQGDLYTCNVAVRDHGEMGKYYADVYGRLKSGSISYIGGATFNVIQKPAAADIRISEADGTKGTFRVEITGVMSASGVEKVTVPVWCEENQNDIKWYDAFMAGDGTYIVNVNVSNHAYHFGNYKVHVYVTMGNGVREFCKKTEVQFNPVNYLYTSAVSSTQQKIILMGCSASKVQFPTWSVENGQDDIVWYNGTNQGNGTWTAIVDSANHNSGGTYNTHVYVTDSSGLHAIAATSYSLTKIPTQKVMMQARANLYSSSTPYLILVNRSTHKVGIFQGWQGNWNYVQYWDCSDGKTSTPTVEGVFRVGSRGYYFDSGDARCYWWTQFYGDYLFHSVLYSKYNGSLMDGRLGMGLSHGCVRLDINNAKWIYDVIPTGTTVVVYH